MTLVSPPPLDSRTADEVIGQVKAGLASTGWDGAAGEPGWALAHLFGRLSELVITRLNQIPEKHFLAFLNTAGLDLLPPRPAVTELTFAPAKDVTGAIEVPAGTQVATKQSETQAEVIFETERDLVVSPSALVKVLAFDPLTAADRTALAGGADPEARFAAFEGEAERERILYLGSDELLSFADATTRQHATITLRFAFASPGDPAADGWQVTWLYWDGAGWADLVTAGKATVTDSTKGFSTDERVTFTHLPELAAKEVNGVTGLWLACKLTGGESRRHLPIIREVWGSRSVTSLSGQPVADALFTATQAGTAFVPLNPADEFMPLGSRPGRLDTFYVACQEAFVKGGATVKLEFAGLLGAGSASSAELAALTLAWDYYSAEGWKELGISTRDKVESKALSFDDTTKALTREATASFTPTIAFTLPAADSKDPPPFAASKVNNQEGYWLRARVMSGSYNVPAYTVPRKEKDAAGNDIPNLYTFIEAQTYAPHVKALRISYSGYSESLSERALTQRHSFVDDAWRPHAAGAFAPFSAMEEGPALYLGFSPGFPVDSWIQLLLDVIESDESAEQAPEVFWEYWNGAGWVALRASDGTQGLRQRGYLGFFGPDDHAASVEFGQSACWLRGRPHLPPAADAGPDLNRTIAGAETTVTLNASGSVAYGRDRGSLRYRWRLLPAAAAGADRTVETPDAEATVSLDASGSRAAPGQSLVRYAWREVSGSPTPATTAETAAPAAAPPYLKAIRTNTVPANNRVTVQEEVLGFSNGKPDQVFRLARPPVLPGAIIAVQEPDRPPDEELAQLEAELGGAALLSDPAAAEGGGVWVQWRQTADFFSSDAASRHYTLDPITGEVRFGDGARGKIPPVGKDNIKAQLYRTHSGAGGNVAAGAITALRNPAGDLAKIKTVSNPEAAAGGSDAESVEEVKVRGPQALKHRQRAVTVEDYVWLAREASGSVAQAWCLPTRNAQGVAEPGWVTVVIVPEGNEAKPLPSPALRRLVQGYLEAHALTNLGAVNQILVKGPEYIEVAVHAQVVPTVPEEADETELAILERLNAFVHPLTGGPARTGWELGRDVYLSEICAEIEAVAGVDHVAGVQLLGSLQQRRLVLDAGDARAPFDVPVGSQVSTLDDRIKLRLAEPLPQGKPLAELAVYGFKAGDEVSVVAADNTIVKTELVIAGLGGDRATFEQPFEAPPDWTTRGALLSRDRGLRLLIAGETTAATGEITGVTLTGFSPGDRACVVTAGLRHPDLELLPVTAVLPCAERIFVPPGHLIYAGAHDIEMVLE